MATVKYVRTQKLAVRMAQVRTSPSKNPQHKQLVSAPKKGKQ